MKARYLFIPLFYLLLCSHTCMDYWEDCIEGNGVIKTENRDLPYFSEIEVHGDMHVTLDTGSVPTARVEADENLLSLIVTRVSGNTLIIETQHNECLQSSHDIRIEVTAPAIREIQMDGSGLVYCPGFTTDNLNLYVSGSGQLSIDHATAVSVKCRLTGSGDVTGRFEVSNIKANLEGSGNLMLEGSAVNAEYDLTGSGRLDAAELLTDVCSADLSGSGQIDTRVNDELRVLIEGSGTVTYRGHPRLSSKINGSGKVVNANR
jgi:hypothetical protein